MNDKVNITHMASIDVAMDYCQKMIDMFIELNKGNYKSVFLDNIWYGACKPVADLCLLDNKSRQNIKKKMFEMLSHNKTLKKLGFAFPKSERESKLAVDAGTALYYYNTKRLVREMKELKGL